MALPNATQIIAEIDKAVAALEAAKNTTQGGTTASFAQGARLFLANAQTPILRAAIYLEGAQDSLDSD